jgi:hypothetical protein
MSPKERDIIELKKLYGASDPRHELPMPEFVKEVCDILDVIVLMDMESLSAEEDYNCFRPVVALGCRAEREAVAEELDHVVVA